jgi:membrane fusion protein, multidrug efflux system
MATDDRVRPERNEALPAADSESNDRSELRRKRLWIIIGLSLLLLIGLVYYFIHRSELAKASRQTQPAGAAITVGQSKTGDMNVYVNALGTVTPLSTVTVYSQITGQVMSVNFHEGQMVKKGDSLIDIDPRPYESLLTEAQGTLQRDEGLLAQARMDLQRYRDAYARNAIAKQQLDDQQQAVAQYEGSVKADQGSLAYDQVQLSYCHLLAPITGRVGLRLVDPGNTVFAGSASTFVVITQLQPITVVFNVAEDDLPQIQEQLTAARILQVDAFDRANEKTLATGNLTSLDNQVDTSTGTVKFRAEFPNKNLALFPNQFVNARLLVQTLQNVTLVPTSAVQRNGTNAFVYVVKPDNTVAVQSITVLTSDDQNSAIKGLDAGVKVATSGFDRLENGAKVQARGQQPGQTRAPTQPGAAGAGGKSTTGGTP